MTTFFTNFEGQKCKLNWSKRNECAKCCRMQWPLLTMFCLLSHTLSHSLSLPKWGFWIFEWKLILTQKDEKLVEPIFRSGKNLNKLFNIFFGRVVATFWGVKNFGGQNKFEVILLLEHKFREFKHFGGQIIWGCQNRMECMRYWKARAPFGIHDIFSMKLKSFRCTCGVLLVRRYCTCSVLPAAYSLDENLSLHITTSKKESNQNSSQLILHT